TDFLDKFFELTGTPEAVAQRTVDLWCAGPEVRPSGARTRASRAMRRGDEALVAAAAERPLGVLGARALSMSEGELQLRDTRRRFRRAGVLRGRDVRLVGPAGGPTYAVLHERASAGFNLTWMLNASWIVPIHP